MGWAMPMAGPRMRTQFAKLVIAPYICAMAATFTMYNHVYGTLASHVDVHARMYMTCNMYMYMTCNMYMYMYMC